MIILTSNGLSSKELLNRTKTYTKNLTSSAIITTASVPYKEKDYHIPDLTTELNSLGLTVDYFDFDTDNASELLKYDVIEINGGNPFYLLKSIRKAKAESIIKEISKTKILIGVSAGAVILQRNINLISEYTPELNDDVGLESFDALGLTDIEILPHYHRFINKFDRFEERAKEYEHTNNCNVIRIDDGQGVVIDKETLII